MSIKLLSGLVLACTLVAALILAPASASAAALVLAPADVAGYWDFNTSTDLGLDSSGSGNDLTKTSGTASYASSGVFGGAIDLGTGSTLTTVSGLFPAGVPTGNASFTIAFWEKASVFNTGAGGVISWGEAITDKSNVVRVDSNHVQHTFCGSGDHPDLYLTGLSPKRGDWHHIAITYDNSTGIRTGYYDGTSIASDNIGTAPPAVVAQGFALGKSVWTDQFAGQLDDVLIVKRALTAGEVTALLGGVTLVPKPGTKRIAREGDMPITLDLKHMERCWRADMRVAAKKANVDSDPMKPIFHIMPAAGTCGDPNGPIYANGKYHMFFQHAPEMLYGKPVSEWEEYEGSYNHTGWGHVSSKDLAYWEHEPVALMAGKGSYDPNLCASGSAVIADDGTAMIFYTGAEPQKQCIARSVDPGLRWWRKDPNNPIISEPPVPSFNRGGFRDPYLWREGDTWNMLVGGSILKTGGTVLHFRSKNLTAWTFVKPMAVGMGENCVAWECPNFLPFENGKAVLFVSPLFDNLKTDSAPRSDVVYTIAAYQGNGEFQPSTWKKIDIGGPNNFYASQAQKTPDGRWLFWGMNLGGSSPGHDWATSLCLPRVVTLRPDGLLGQEPPVELQKLRRAHWGEKDRALEGEYVLGARSNTFEILAEIEVGNAKVVGMDLRGSEDFRSKNRIYFDVENAKLHADGFSADFKLLGDERKVLRLHAFVDRSVVETFVNRRECATVRAFHNIEDKAMRLFSQGGTARIRSVDVWEMGSIWLPPKETK